MPHLRSKISEQTAWPMMVDLELDLETPAAMTIPPRLEPGYSAAKTKERWRNSRHQLWKEQMIELDWHLQTIAHWVKIEKMAARSILRCSVQRKEVILRYSMQLEPSCFPHCLRDRSFEMPRELARFHFEMVHLCQWDSR